jgi:hypothetical protein
VCWRWLSVCDECSSDQADDGSLSFGLCKHEIPICLYGTSFASVLVSEVLESISGISPRLSLDRLSS